MESVSKRSLGKCDRCPAFLYFPPWPRIVFHDGQKNEVVCERCVLPGEVTGPPAYVHVAQWDR